MCCSRVARLPNSDRLLVASSAGKVVEIGTAANGARPARTAPSTAGTSPACASRAARRSPAATTAGSSGGTSPSAASVRTIDAHRRWIRRSPFRPTAAKLASVARRHGLPHLERSHRRDAARAARPCRANAAALQLDALRLHLLRGRPEPGDRRSRRPRRDLGRRRTAGSSARSKRRRSTPGTARSASARSAACAGWRSRPTARISRSAASARSATSTPCKARRASRCSTGSAASACSEFTGAQGIVNRLVYHPRGQWLCAIGGGSNGLVMFYDPSRRAMIHQAEPPDARPRRGVQRGLHDAVRRGASQGGGDGTRGVTGLFPSSTARRPAPWLTSRTSTSMSRTPGAVPALEVMPMPMSRVPEIQRQNEILQKWRGAHAQLWSYTASLAALEIRLFFEGQPANLRLLCSPCLSISGPVFWTNAELIVAADSSRSAPPFEGFQG